MLTLEPDVIDLLAEVPVARTVTVADLADFLDELAAYHAYYAPFFRPDQQPWAAFYLRGLLTADVPRKNIEAMVLRLRGAGPDADNQVRAAQYFISQGAWDDAAVLAAHQRLVDATLGEADGVLILDGSDVPKQGTHSVGGRASGVAPAASATTARPESISATPAARATRCWTGGSSCPRSGAATPIATAGRTAASPTARPSEPSRRWRPRCWPG